MKYTKEQRDKIKRYRKSFRNLERASNRLIRSKAFRIWVERDESINILNYPIRRITDRKIIKQIREEITH